tara:strand:+ start:4056 stop:5219 length:1164 start_codon:yes stop_codon:yes gene_type:complete
MSRKNKKGFDTRAIHSGQDNDPTTGAVMTPIYASSTFAQESPGVHKGYEYSRSSNPTRKALEDCIADLENGGTGHAFSSGMAATSTILELLNTNDHLVACNDLYGGTYRLFETIRSRTSGISSSFVDCSDLKEIEKAINKNTRLLWIETPSNPLLKVFDLTKIIDVVKGKGIITVCDNTFCSPWIQNPLDHGFDIVMHSASKYICGHSDVIAGIAVVSSERKDLSEEMHYLLNASGGIAGPFESFLLLRSLKTLSVRMQRHCENAMKVAQFLESHPKVSETIYPGLENHPQYEIAKKQMRGFGGMITFIVNGGVKQATEILQKLEIFTLAESLGGAESLASHPSTMTHASIPKHIRESIGIGDGLIRLSVGIESVDDLIADLEQALG